MEPKKIDPKGPLLVILWPPPPEYKEHRVDFAKALMEKLRPACSAAPVAVVKSMDFIVLLVEGHIADINAALHHSRDNQTRYLVVRPQLPVASFGVATADQWIRARQG